MEKGGSDQSGISSNTRRAHFVLVHGIGHGSWCWYKIRTLLESSGHRVTCVDLASAGVDPTDPDTLFKFEDYNKPLLDLIAALPENEQGAPDLSRYGDDVFDLRFGNGADQPPTSAVMARKYLRQIMYNTSPPEDVTLASMLLKPGPVIALRSARFDGLTSSSSEAVERVYIKAIQDNVVKLEQQETMIWRWPPTKVFSLDADHSPFFSAPFSLFGVLLNVAGGGGDL
ncbi:Methylesterase 17 [Linum perenne]